MKKSIVNDKVIRAMAIGISAMLATTTPMTALAAGEGEGTTPEPDTGEKTKSESKVAEAAESVGTAQSSADTVKDDVEENVKAGEAGTNSEGKDLAQNVKDVAANVENTEVKEGAPLKNANAYITIADAQIDVAEANDEPLNTAYGQAKKAAAAAATIASDAKDTMNAANEKAGEQVKQIENAASVEEANAAYDELAATADQAQKDFDAKLAAYNTAKDAYDEAAAKVAKYEKAYNEAIATANDNADAAKKELEQAQKNAKALEDAVAAAKDAVDASAKDAMEIADMEKLTREDGGLNWKNEDKLFIAIMENYYLPEKLDIQGATVTRVQGKDNNEYNYFVAEYSLKDENGNDLVDENGKVRTEKKYFNYKMDGNSKDDIVIFEKREVEIFGDANETPDQYVKDDDQKTVVDVVAGQKNNTVVNAGGKYYEYVSKGDKTLVSNSEITGTSKKDVAVDENTKQESWSYDAKTGELVKTVKANVTTITYTDATFTSDNSYATDAERDTAAADKKKELEDATGKDATITETKKTTYTATGTYIPTFTKTVNVKNEEVEWKHTNKLTDFGVKTEEEAVAQVKKEQENNLKKDIQKDDDLYFLGVSSNLAVTGHTEDKRHDDSDFLVSGTVSATYAKVTKQTVDQSTFGALWDDIKSLFGGQSTNEKLENAAKAAIEAEGGIFLSANWADGSFNKATIRYVAGVKVTTNENQTEQAAKDDVKTTALAQAKKNGAAGVYNVKTKDTDTVAHTTYSYTVNYLEGTKTTENEAVTTETYGNAVGLSGQIIQNKNYLDKNILLTQKDKGYRTFVDDAKALTKALTDKYEGLLEKAKQANADVTDAQAKVDALKKEIEDLENKSSNTKKLADLKAELAIAEADRDAAEETLYDIIDKLKDAETTRDEVVDKLTPKKPGGGSGDNGGNGGNRDNNPGGGTSGETDDAPGADTTTEDTTTVPTVITTTATDDVVVTAPVAAVANGAGAGNVAAGNAGAGNAAGNVATGNQGVVTIEDEAAPLAASIDDQDATDTKEAKEDVKTVTIEDEEAPLDASIDQEKMSWWWLLIVMVLGATGYEMYRKHQEKKKAAEEIKVEK